MEIGFVSPHMLLSAPQLGCLLKAEGNQPDTTKTDYGNGNLDFLGDHPPSLSKLCPFNDPIGHAGSRMGTPVFRREDVTSAFTHCILYLE